VTDDHGPALAPGSKTHGGIAVLDTQARNPLWAFAKYRLGASDLPAYADLYSRNVRGVFLHRAVELVWRMLDDQAHLIRARDDKTLGDLIRQAVDRAGDECLHDYGRVLKMLETRRAYEVIGAWLAFECERPPFAVAALEQQCAWSFGPQALSLRVDRIDRLLGDDRLAIIDYKSGMGPLDPRNDWTRSRPISLQLPFYAAVVAEQPGQVAAMALARLHARKVEASGLMDGGCELRGLATPQDWPECEGQSWEQIMEGWRRAIEGLADEYVAGRAANDVWNPADLDYCDALPFLRLNEEP
jgi:RecB family exonuclease